MHAGRILARATALLAVPAVLAAQGELPLKRTPTKTSPAISATDLMSYLYAFADDSMGGRAGGTPFNTKGTDYLARHLKRMGVEPAGENGTYFQDVPLMRRAFDTTSTLTFGETSLKYGEGFLALGPRGATARAFSSGQVVYGGAFTDSSTWVSAEAVQGKVVVMRPPSQLSARLISQVAGGRYKGAALVVFPMLDMIPANFRRQVAAPQTAMMGAGLPEAPIAVLVSAKDADALLGAAIASAQPGATGGTLSGRLTMSTTQLPARNVVGIVRGSDPKLRTQYVAIGAHNDHVPNQMVVDHDSLRAFNTVVRPGGADSPMRPATADEMGKVKAILDSLRKIRPARLDSISNGADDDGSGSVTVLEVAEAIAAMKVKPKRSILFLWYTGEELGLLGSQWYTEHPTVPRDSVVAAINMDMVGRGLATDMVVTDKGKERFGGPTYLQLVGSRRLSTEYGDLIETLNKARKTPFEFDYTYDANGHPQNIYCRSDHYNWARWGVPVVFFTTGLHRDYHQVTDEPQYIDYPHMAEVAKFSRDVLVAVANNPKAPVVDKPKPDPYGVCRQ